MDEKGLKPISERLPELADDEYASFQSRITPTVPREDMLGVRVPRLREIEKTYRNTPEADTFLRALPHRYYDENLLHSIFISNMKDYDAVLSALTAFLPHVDNWAVCDTLRPKAFRKHQSDLPEHITAWIVSSEVYTCRFGIDMLMTYYLDEEFRPELLTLPASIRSEEYYVNMMLAWFYATALTKQWDSALPYLTERRLSAWVHNKTVQKACESYCVPEERKRYLKTLKIGKADEGKA